MPILPLPPIDDGVPLAGGDLPVSDYTDVAAEWSAELQRPDQQQPVILTIQTGQAAGFLEWQRESSYAAAQSDPSRATAEYLDECGDERSCHRKHNEADGAYRARMFAGPAVVDPDDIISAVNALMASYGATIQARYAEGSDAWFTPLAVQDIWKATTAYLFGALIAPGNGFIYRASQITGTTGGSAPTFPTIINQTVNDGGQTWTCITVAPITAVPAWSSHLFALADGGGPPITPNYPDRLYPGSAPGGQTPISSRRPPGAMMNGPSVAYIVSGSYPWVQSNVVLNNGTYGRWFMLRVPDLSSVDANVAALVSSQLDIWKGTTAYLFGATMTPGNGLQYQQTALSGTTGGSAPTFPTTVGASVSDGTAQWTCLGPVPPTPQSTVGFFLSGDVGVDGVNVQNATYLYDITSTVSDIYNALIGIVNSMIGQGVSWSLWIDPGLT